MLDIIKNSLINIIRIKSNFKKNIYIGKKTRLNLNTTLEGGNKIGDNNIISSAYIGYGSYMGSNNILYSTHIGKYCSIASDIKIVIGNHPTKKFVSTHPAFFSTKKQSGFTYVKEQLFEESQITHNGFFLNIGNDVWIGNNVSFKGGVNIGDGAVIGANSLVIKDCEPYCIYGGTPAKKIGQRFTDEQIQFLCQLKWWNKGEDWIESNIDKFSSVDEFIKELKNE